MRDFILGVVLVLVTLLYIIFLYLERKNKLVKILNKYHYAQIVSLFILLVISHILGHNILFFIVVSDIAIEVAIIVKRKRVTDFLISYNSMNIDSRDERELDDSDNVRAEWIMNILMAINLSYRTMKTVGEFNVLESILESFKDNIDVSGGSDIDIDRLSVMNGNDE